MFTGLNFHILFPVPNLYPFHYDNNKNNTIIIACIQIIIAIILIIIIINIIIIIIIIIIISIIIIGKALALKTSELRQVRRPGDTITQAFKQPYDVWCLTGQVIKGV